MDEQRQEVEALLQQVSGWIPVPDEYAALLSVVLAAILFFTSIVGRVTSFITGVRVIWRRIFGKKSEPPEIKPTARVLRAVWLRDREVHQFRTIDPPEKSIPIISFINMKGGVGKTTLAANVGAHLRRKGSRVLFIDFDYQATLSLMVASTAGLDRLDANAFMLLENRSYEEVQQRIHQFESYPQAGLLAAHYSLFRTEMELFANWAADNTHFDIRFSLQKILEDSVCQNSWDVVIIDCGPRFTTSTINALCASTHMIVPTILDEPSAQAVGYLSKEIDIHRAELFPYLRLLGVIPSMVQQDPPRKRKPTFSISETEQLEALEDVIRKTWVGDDYILKMARIPDRATISKNAHEIAYESSAEARRVFGRAGDIIRGRLRDEGFKIK